MQRIVSLIRMALAFLLLVAAVPGAKASPPPKREEPVIDRRPALEVPLERQREIRWHLDRNCAIGATTTSQDGKSNFLLVRAVDVGTLDEAERKSAITLPPIAENVRPRVENLRPIAEKTIRKSTFTLWRKKLDAPDLRSSSGEVSVVDENVFTDLRLVSAQRADRLDLDGILIGRVKLAQYDPLELVRFLVVRGIVDANIHVKATVTGAHFTSERGEWFSLHSDDPYWTSRRYNASYDFGIHVAPEGTIRLINAKNVGRLLANDNETSDSATP